MAQRNHEMMSERKGEKQDEEKVGFKKDAMDMEADCS